jgi:hypothetical protein
LFQMIDQIKHEKSKQFSFLLYIHPFILFFSLMWFSGPVCTYLD